MGQESPERVYDWDVAGIGDTSTPIAVQATAEGVAEYCRAARYENPVYTDQAAAREAGLPGIIVPPAMVLVLATAHVADVAATKGYVLPRPRTDSPALSLVKLAVEFQGSFLVPGDVVTSVTTVEDKFESDQGRFITFRVKGHNQRDEPVVDYHQTFLWADPYA